MNPPRSTIFVVIVPNISEITEFNEIISRQLLCLRQIGSVNRMTNIRASQTDVHAPDGKQKSY